MGLLTNSVSLIGRVGKYKECKAFETGGDAMHNQYRR